MPDPANSYQNAPIKIREIPDPAQIKPWAPVTPQRPQQEEAVKDNGRMYGRMKGQPTLKLEMLQITYCFEIKKIWFILFGVFFVANFQ